LIHCILIHCCLILYVFWVASVHPIGHTQFTQKGMYFWLNSIHSFRRHTCTLVHSA
jgi:hypothetical protein